MEIATGSKSPLSDNITIEFRVSRDWIAQNNIDIATIRLAHYHEGDWQTRQANQTAEDEDYLYFNTETPGFSIFSIVGDEYREIIEEPIVQEPQFEQQTEEDKPSEAESTQTPGFTAIFAVALIVGAAMITRQKSNR